MSDPRPAAPRKFKFVGGPSRKRRRCVPPPGNNANKGKPTLSSPPQSRPGATTAGASTTSHLQPTSDGAAAAAGLFESFWDWMPAADTDLSINTNTVQPDLELNDPSSLVGYPFYFPALPPTEDQQPSTPENGLNRDSTRLQDRTSIPGAISDSIDRLFAQYDREFCVWPLTHDFEANPFRYNIETGRSSPLLWHSILALSYKHIHHETGSCLNKSDVHKSKALQLFEKQEGDPSLANARANLLDGLLILMTLDCATSAQGPWVAHLRRAQKIIETLRELRIQKTPRIQAQVDMLVWWDVTLGLTTRQGFVLSGATFDSVIHSESSSAFYNISGCPRELFRHMFRLGKYAHEFELASHMTCVSFDMGPVLEVEKAIKEWRAPEYDDPDVDFNQLPETMDLPTDCGVSPVETAHYVQDLHYSAQAWRFALLVYIERVFKWRHGGASTMRMTLLARKALNNALSCRRSVMVQKQLLLPVFLAACETEDETLREAARDYCSWWSNKTRYDMFITTLGLLEEVWTAAESDAESWWGSLIDLKSGVGTASCPDHLSTRQYLFG